VIHCGLAVVGPIGLWEQAATRGQIELAPTLAAIFAAMKNHN
jgi:hypothetical protein